MRATLTASCRELTRPMNSSISFGLLPAAMMRVGWSMSRGMAGVLPSTKIPRHLPRRSGESLGGEADRADRRAENDANRCR